MLVGCVGNCTVSRNIKMLSAPLWQDYCYLYQILLDVCVLRSLALARVVMFRTQEFHINKA